MENHIFDPHDTQEMPEIREGHPKSELPVSYPNNGFNGRPIGSVRFSLPSFMNLFGTRVHCENGWRQARTQFEVDGWLVTIDRLPDADESFAKIRDTGEHYHTHLGHIQRADSSEFSWAQVDEFLDFLYYLFSFACASHRSAQEIIALDRFGKFLFFKSESQNLLGSAKNFSWFPEGFENPFSSLAPGMHQIWTDPHLNEVCIFLVNVLSESNRDKLIIDFKFVLSQTALELLANTIFVEAWSQNAPDASGKIRGLLHGLMIDATLPGMLPNLYSEGANRSTNYPGETNWADGPQAIVQIRNMVTHADVKKRRKLFGLNDQAKFEAAMLAIHYVEMASLWLFGYDGSVSTRIDLPQMLGKHVQTPWPAGGSRPGTAAP